MSTSASALSLFGKVVTAGGGELLDGILALLEFLHDDSHVVVFSEGAHEFHLLVLSGGLEQAQSAEAHLILGLVSLDVVLFDLFSDAHTTSFLPGWRSGSGGLCPNHDGKAAKLTLYGRKTKSCFLRAAHA